MIAWDWQALAACDGMDLNLFFGHEREQYDQASKRLREEQARAVCASCPVTRECYEAAEVHREYGIWAGLERDERAARHRRETRNVREKAARRAERVA